MMKTSARFLLVAVLGIAVCTVAAFSTKDDNLIQEEEDVSNRQDPETQVDSKRAALPVDSLLHGAAGMDQLGGKRAGRPIDNIMHGFRLPMARRRDATDHEEKKEEDAGSRRERAAPIDALYGGLLPGSLGTKRAAPIDSIYGGLGLPISGKRAPHPNDSIDKDPPVMAERSPIDAIISGGRGLPMSYKRAAPIDSLIGGHGLSITGKRAVAPIDSLIGGHGLSITGKRRSMALPIDNIIGGYGLPISVRVGNKDRQRGAESKNDEATWLQSIW